MDFFSFLLQMKNPVYKSLLKDMENEHEVEQSRKRREFLLASYKSESLMSINKISSKKRMQLQYKRGRERTAMSILLLWANVLVLPGQEGVTFLSTLDHMDTRVILQSPPDRVGQVALQSLPFFAECCKQVPNAYSLNILWRLLKIITSKTWTDMSLLILNKDLIHRILYSNPRIFSEALQ